MKETNHVEILERCGIDTAAVRTAAEDVGADPGKVMLMLAVYAEQGLDLGRRDTPPCLFVREADVIAAGIGEDAVGRIVEAAVPEECCWTDPEEKLPMILILCRFGGKRGMDVIRSLRTNNVYVRNKVEMAAELSPRIEGVEVRGKYGWEYGYMVWNRLMYSPYPSCIPDGLPDVRSGSGEITCSASEVGKKLPRDIRQDAENVTYKLRITSGLRIVMTEKDTGTRASELERRLLLKDGVSDLDRYLGVLRVELEEILQKLYLGMEYDLDGWRFAQWTEDPLIARFACGTVFVQDGTPFMLRNGRLLKADGGSYELTEDPVGIPHPVNMDPKDTERFREMLPKNRKPVLSQLCEPIYDVERIPFLLPQNRPVEIASRVFLRMSDRTVGAENPCGVSWAQEVHGEWNCRKDCLDYKLKANDPISNHYLYMADVATQADRIKNNDSSVVPLLTLTKNVKAPLKRAIQHGADAVVAELLEVGNRQTRSEISDLAI